jgi:hypothetical protein
MRRGLRLLLVGLLTALALTGVAPARAGVVVKLDGAHVKATGPQACTNGFCTTSYAGRGKTLGGRGWTITMTSTTPPQCRFGSPYGTWAITADDGSGDGLTGRLQGGDGWPLGMSVTGGTGAYAGATAPIRGQNFVQPGTPNLLLVGTGDCGFGYVLVHDVYVGQLEFHLN